MKEGGKEERDGEKEKLKTNRLKREKEILVLPGDMILYLEKPKRIHMRKQKLKEQQKEFGKITRYKLIYKN